MSQSTLRPQNRTINYIGMAAIVFTIGIQAHAVETRRCQINGKTIITNLTCEQLVNEAGAPPPGS